MFSYALMIQQTERLERLISEELGECCEAEIEERIEPFRAYRSIGD